MKIEDKLKMVFGNDVELPTLYTEEAYVPLVQESISRIRTWAASANTHNEQTMRRTCDMKAAHKDAESSLRCYWRIVKHCEKINSQTPQQFIHAKNKEIVQDWIDDLLLNMRGSLVETLTNQLLDAES